MPLTEREEVRVFEHLCPEASSWPLAVDSFLSQRDRLEGQRPERTEAREGSAARVGGALDQSAACPLDAKWDSPTSRIFQPQSPQTRESLDHETVGIPGCLREIFFFF